MGLRMLGDSAWLFEAGGNDARGRLELILRLVKLLEKQPIPEIHDILSSFDTLAVHFDPADGTVVLDWLTALPPPANDEQAAPPPPVIEVPVVYGGPDLQNLASALKLSEKEIIALHSGAEYTVAAVGFSPGFPYLTGLPAELRIPRQHTPRAVEAGSVAIAGDQSGIYPFASQGGWHVLGRTSARLFDPQRAKPALLKPGDRLHFVPVDRLESSPLPEPSEAPVEGAMEIIEPGALTTVQDLGRPGFQKIGVSPGGAADPISARVVNRLVGNPDDAAVLECTMTGPVLRFHEAARVAWVGWAGTQSGKPVEVSAGGKIDLTGRLLAVRGYIAVSGGIDVPLVMASRSTDVRAGFGGHHGRTLRSGDRLAIGRHSNGPAPGEWRAGWPHVVSAGATLELRFIKGIQAAWFTPEVREKFRTSIYQTSPESDRMGVRLDGPPLLREPPRELVSQPVVAGSIQVPPDGRPIVLMAERQTIGGYPQIGHVISADLPKLARAWPGTRLRFREVTIHEAREAWSDLQRELGLLQAGLDFLR
jgi:KipI family sensor histidine kinase inhibitor